MIIERMAQIIDPEAFRQYAAKKEYCLAEGESEEEAVKFAEWAHRRDIDEAMRKAEAIIVVIRDPSKAMIQAGNIAWSSELTVEGIFRAMIDAALNEQVSGWGKSGTCLHTSFGR